MSFTRISTDKNTASIAFLEKNPTSTFLKVAFFLTKVVDKVFLSSIFLRITRIENFPHGQKFSSVSSFFFFFNFFFRPEVGGIFVRKVVAKLDNTFFITRYLINKRLKNKKKSHVLIQPKFVLLEGFEKTMLVFYPFW